ncbi:MAG: hypothetical protein OXT67_08530, partial [Zetaproteobacteria bacterium]|nr:hypothetical protein [Zetaproteobacteria bacterium]
SAPHTQAQMQQAPLVISMQYRRAEAIFSQEISHLSLVSAPKVMELKKALNVRMQSLSNLTPLRLDFPDFLVREVKAENNSLREVDFPRVAHIYGAWAYLDKGRAWGLKMGDRLEVPLSSGKIKGHVVGYYGPEKNIQSMNGYTVVEGAIVYVRKGQKQLQIGDMVDYDRRSYPTSWPPVPTTP